MWVNQEKRIYFEIVVWTLLPNVKVIRLNRTKLIKCQNNEKIFVDHSQLWDTEEHTCKHPASKGITGCRPQLLSPEIHYLCWGLHWGHTSLGWSQPVSSVTKPLRHPGPWKLWDSWQVTVDHHRLHASQASFLLFLTPSPNMSVSQPLLVPTTGFFMDIYPNKLVCLIPSWHLLLGDTRWPWLPGFLFQH